MNRDDLLKTVHFDFPHRIPVIFHINQSCWDHYPRDFLAGLITDFPTLFPEGIPDFVREGRPTPHAPWCRSDKPWTDPWGCLWETTMSGIIGAVTSHPLPDWSHFDSYAPPDWNETTHWYPVAWKEGEVPGGGSIGFFSCLRSGEIGHGHTLLKLFDILGYERTILELYDETPEMLQLMTMLEEFNDGLVARFLDTAKVEWLGYAEDLGMQSGPLISPELFRKHILPAYRRLMKPAADRGAVIHLHTDGDIRALLPDLLTLPLGVLNLQDTVNGIDWIAEEIKGRFAIDLDVDRVVLSREARPEAVADYLESVVTRLFDPAGGLILTYGLYPGVPPENVRALAESFRNIAEYRRNS